METLYVVPAECGSPGIAYRSFGAAVAVARPGDSIRLAPGVYREKIVIRVPNLSIEGAGADKTILVWNDSAKRPLPDGEAMGTFNSYAFYIGAPSVRVSNLTVENDAGAGDLVGQAVAVYADADDLAFDHCRFRARQDTLCTGPLPKNPAPKGINLTIPVAGLGDDEPGLPFRQSYRDCEIEGDVDFIFGSAQAVFNHCLIRSLDRGGRDTYIAAPSTYPGQEAGFVFNRCALVIDGASGPVTPNAIASENAVPAGRHYLCRPWRISARCVFIDCEMGARIDPVAWHDWDKPEAHTAGFFGEYGSRGEGARLETRPDWVRRLSAAEAAALLKTVGLESGDR